MLPFRDEGVLKEGTWASRGWSGASALWSSAGAGIRGQGDVLLSGCSGKMSAFAGRFFELRPEWGVRISLPAVYSRNKVQIYGVEGSYSGNNITGISPKTARTPQTNGMWGSRRCYSYLKGIFCRIFSIFYSVQPSKNAVFSLNVMLSFLFAYFFSIILVSIYLGNLLYNFRLGGRKKMRICLKRNIRRFMAKPFSNQNRICTEVN